jgi:hypothetical protein
MDINGAKALKQRLGAKGADEAPPASVDAHVPEDAPPVFHWLGISRSTPETPPAGSDEEPAASGVSLFRRLGLSLR